jgi:hypothetical protein
MRGLADSVQAVMRVLSGRPPDALEAPEAAAPRGQATLDAVRPRLAKYWPL